MGLAIYLSHMFAVPAYCVRASAADCWLARTLRSSAPLRKSLRWITEGVVICALGVGLTEGAVRLFFADELTSVGRVSRFDLVPSKVPGMPYEWAPGLFRFTNNLGMRRVVNATVAKPPGVFRLLVIGDSVADYVTDSNRIEDLFASRFRKE